MCSRVVLVKIGWIDDDLEIVSRLFLADFGAHDLCKKMIQYVCHRPVFSRGSMVLRW